MMTEKRNIKIATEVDVPIAARKAALIDSDHWRTPQHVFDRLNNIFHFDLDAAADAGSSKCANYLGLDNGRDSLVVPWQDYGSRIFVNPPFSPGAGPLIRWVGIMRYTAEAHRRLVCAVLPATPCAQWFYEHVKGRAVILFTKARMKFEPPPGMEINPETGKKRTGGRTDTMIVVWLEDFHDWAVYQ